MPEPPAAMRERFEKEFAPRYPLPINKHADGNYIVNDTFIAWTAFRAGWQAAQPSSEQIEAAARRIAMIWVDQSLSGRAFADEQKAIKRILREELGGGTE